MEILGSHAPGGMAESFPGGDRGQVRLLASPEGSTAAGQDDAFDFFQAAALQGLEDGAVFAVDGQQLGMAACGQVHDQGTGHDQGFLVGHGDGFAGFQGGPGAFQPGGADDGADHHVDVRVGDHALEALGP